MKVLIIDNYDSFTYNLYQHIGEILGERKNQGELDSFEIIVYRNDQVTLEQVEAAKPDRIIISPGPGSPDDEKYFGICAKVIGELGKTTPLLGVCLGMQGIAQVFGGNIVKAALPMHGKISAITHNGTGLFRNIPDQLEVMRYHSLIAEPASMPDCLELTAVVSNGKNGDLNKLQPMQTGDNIAIMGIKHREYPIYGIQFHPESFATEGGKELISNFLFAG